MRKNELNKKNIENGITLIALIITIIVLLILAGIAIGALISNNSVLKQAGSARNETRESEEAEKVNLAIMDAVTNASKTISGELTTEFVKNAIKGQFGQEAVSKVKGEGPWTYEGKYKTYEIDKTGEVHEPNATIAKDSNDDEYYLPRGATHIEDTTVDSGLVISYKGSEFVWIPINSDLTAKGTSKKMAKYIVDENEKDSKGRIKYEGVLYDDSLNVRSETENGLGTNGHREPADLQNTTYGDWSTTGNRGFDLIIRHIDEYKGLDKTNSLDQNTIKTNWAKQLQEEYDAMIESVKKYGGFYVGRYETSTDIKSIKDATPISAGTVIDGYAQTWYGLYQRQRNFTTSTDSMVSSMIWGSQYDAMLNWAKESETDTGIHVTQNGYGNHTGSKKDTGTVLTDVINNIYDLEGNMREWTLEAYGVSRVFRGGCYHYNDPPAYHGSYYPLNTFAYDGSRLALYIK